MVMNLGKYASHLNILYSDRMDIYRHVDVKEGYVTHSELSKEPVYSDIPCKMTTKQEDIPETNDPAYNEYEMLGAVYCKNDVNIQKGDVLKIRCIDGGVQYAEFQGLASYPRINPLCKVTLLLDKKKAAQHGV